MSLTLTLLFIATYVQPTLVTLPPTDTLVVRTHFYCNHCDGCESCRPLIESELQFAEGVRYLSFDLKAHTITIAYDSRKNDPANLRKTIAGLGFAADDLPYDPAGHQKLDGCCRKP